MIGGAATVFWPSPPAPEPETIPIYFEVVEASALDAAESPVDSEDGGRGATALPVPSGSVPVDAEAMGTDPENMGTDPEIMGTEIMGTDPAENMGTDPKENEDNVKESSINYEKSTISDVSEQARVETVPFALNKIVPTYPRLARRKGHEGVVTVAISVAKDGVVAYAEVMSSSGYKELDEAALSAVRSARFAPATSDGVSVRGELRLTFDFRLK